MKKTGILPAIIAIAIVFASAGCVSSDGAAGSVSANGQASASSASETTTAGSLSTIDVEYKRADLDTEWDSSDSSYITLNVDSITLDSEVATTDGSKVTNTSAGSSTGGMGMGGGRTEEEGE